MSSMYKKTYKNDDVLEFGFVTKHIRDLFAEYYCYSSKFFKKNSKHFRSIQKISKQLDKLKSDLEDEMFLNLEKMEEKNYITSSLDVFYGIRNNELIHKCLNMMKNDIKLIKNKEV